MSFLTQQRFPRLWTIFQTAVGGTHDKRRLAVKRFTGAGSVLEIGCATGNIAVAFRAFAGVAYTGIDIDARAIAVARRRFRNDSRFRFVVGDLRQAFDARTTFDYILFAGCLHHMPDALAVDHLQYAARHLPAAGRVVVVDPLSPRDTDPWFVRQFIRIEQGDRVRSGAAMLALLADVNSLRLDWSEEVLIGATPIGRPVCARFGVYELRLRPSSARGPSLHEDSAR